LKVPPSAGDSLQTLLARAETVLTRLESLLPAPLPEPNWKEKKRLGARIERGYRLACQLWITHDIELSQEATPLADVVAPGGVG